MQIVPFDLNHNIDCMSCMEPTFARLNARSTRHLERVLTDVKLVKEDTLVGHSVISPTSCFLDRSQRKKIDTTNDGSADLSTNERN